MSAAKRQRELNRAKKEHENAKLSAQIATGNVVLTNIAESVMAKLIERQAAQIEMLRDALGHALNGLLYYHHAKLVKRGIDAANEALSATPDQALDQFAAKSGDLMRERIVETILASANGFPMREIRAIPSVTPEDMK